MKLQKKLKDIKKFICLTCSVIGVVQMVNSRRGFFSNEGKLFTSSQNEGKLFTSSQFITNFGAQLKEIKRTNSDSLSSTKWVTNNEHFVLYVFDISSKRSFQVCPLTTRWRSFFPDTSKTWFTKQVTVFPFIDRPLSTQCLWNMPFFHSWYQHFIS